MSPENKSMLPVIILDFDGVILESVSVKTEAFRTLFSDVPEHVEEIVQFHRDNGGMSRFDKFRFIYNNILHEELTEKKFGELSEQFASIVFRAVIHADYVPGAHQFLERYHTRTPLYVVSATPEKELRQIIEARGMSRYFRDVFGAPRKKTECISEIVKLTGAHPESVIFIGDAKNDYDAAGEAGVRFIGRVKPGDGNRFDGLPGTDAIIPDLHGLTRYVEVNY
jgi:beta-phosphoglucomutase